MNIEIVLLLGRVAAAAAAPDWYLKFNFNGNDQTGDRNG